jgi:spermidine synthase
MKLRLALAVADHSGFIALSYEIVWYRVLSVMTEGTAATFGILLAAYLFGLAIGARVSAVFCRGDGGDARVLRVLSLFVALANVVAATVVPVFGWSAKFTDFRIGVALVAIGAAFLGSVLPLVSHFGIEPDEHAGSRLSYVYLANIVGSAAGSLVTGFVLMDRLPLVSIARLLVVFGFALAAALFAASGPRRGSLIAASGVLGACAVLAFAVTPIVYDRIYERLVYKNEYDGTQRFAQVIENKSGVISVTTDGTIYGGGAYDGVLNVRLQDDDRNGIVRAYIVGALHPSPREVLMVGLSGGAWAQVVAHLPGVERMTVIEINPGYIDVIRSHPEVSGLLRNPKVDVVFDDGRRWLQRHPDRRFDFIVMNTTMHWRAHATNILSTEFLAIARRHLAPGGVLYFNTTSSYDVQLTAAKTFPHFKRVANFVAVSDAPFDFDRARWRHVLETMQIEGRPVLDLANEADRALFDQLRCYNDMEPAWSIKDRYEKTHRVVTDDNMVTEWLEPLRYPDLH